MSATRQVEQADRSSSITTPDGRRGQVSRRWSVLVGAGVAWIVLGFVVLRFDSASVAVVSGLVGVMALLAGFGEAMRATLSRGGWRVWHVVLAALLLVPAVVAFGTQVPFRKAEPVHRAVEQAREPDRFPGTRTTVVASDQRSHARPRGAPVGQDCRMGGPTWTSGPLLDRTVLDSLERDLGDASVVREVVETYLGLLPERRSAVAEAAGAHDLVRLRRSAHALGSASAVVGAVELRGLCRELEHLDPTSETAVLDPLLEAWGSSCARTQDALRTWAAGS